MAHRARRQPELFQSGCKILLAESGAGFNNELSELFDNRGYSVDSCIPGEECLNRLSTQHYQLIILDIILPEVDGFSLLTPPIDSNTGHHADK